MLHSFLEKDNILFVAYCPQIEIMKKILVIDDDPSIIMVMVGLLSLIGYNNVVTAADGDEGTRKFESEKPDLVITDFNMPKINGIGVLRYIRSKSKTPVILMSSETSVASGTDYFLKKPFTSTQLKCMIKKCMAEQPVAQVTVGEVIEYIGFPTWQSQGQSDVMSDWYEYPRRIKELNRSIFEEAGISMESALPDNTVLGEKSQRLFEELKVFVESLKQTSDI